MNFKASWATIPEKNLIIGIKKNPEYLNILVKYVMSIFSSSFTHCSFCCLDFENILELISMQSLILCSSLYFGKYLCIE